MITIVKYSKITKISQERISKICNARVIWGGDKTINDLRNIQINERTNRFNFC